MRSGKLFRVIHVVSEILTARFPKDTELALLDPILDPIKMHANSTGSFLPADIVGDVIHS